MGQDLLNVLVVGSIYTLFALGLTLSWGVLNVLNLAHGAIFMFAGIVGYLVTKDQPAVAVDRPADRDGRRGPDRASCSSWSRTCRSAGAPPTCTPASSRR